MMDKETSQDIKLNFEEIAKVISPSKRTHILELCNKKLQVTYSLN